MPKIYYQEDYNLSLLEGKTIAVIGYGNQGHAHALDLKGSGCNVVTGSYEGSRPQKKVQRQGSEVYTAAGASRKADVITVPVNDEKQTAMYRKSATPNLCPGVMLIFTRGFVIHLGQIVPPKDMDVAMIAPEAPGHTVRSEYQRGRGTPCLVAVYQGATSKTVDMVLVYGQGIGGARTGILKITFRIEIETDLFGEQTALCGSVCTLIKAGFETPVGAGYTPGNVYLGCVHGMKLTVNLIYESGFTDAYCPISNTTGYDNYTTGPKIVTNETKKAMRKILLDIQDGSFAKEWLLKNQVGCPHFNTVRKNETERPLRKVGAELRRLHSWNDMDKLINNQLITSATQAVSTDLGGYG